MIDVLPIRKVNREVSILYKIAKVMFRSNVAEDMKGQVAYSLPFQMSWLGCRVISKLFAQDRLFLSLNESQISAI